MSEAHVAFDLALENGGLEIVCEVEHCDRPAVWKIEPVKPDADCDMVVCCQACVAEVLAGTSIYVEKHTIIWLNYEEKRRYARAHVYMEQRTELDRKHGGR